MKCMILAAGRGERLRPHTDTVPKPLLPVGGKPLIAWQIERLKAGGVTDFVINVAWKGHEIREALGEGSRFGTRIRYSIEEEALETLGGIVRALPMLGEAPFVVVSADIHTRYPYEGIVTRARAALSDRPSAHLVLVPNPPYHAQGDMGLADGRITLDPPRLTYGNIAVMHPRLFEGVLPVRAKLFPWLYRFIGTGQLSGETYQGPWINVGTVSDWQAADAVAQGRPPAGSSQGS